MRLSFSTLLGLAAVLTACHSANTPVEGAGNNLDVDDKVACGPSTCTGGDVCCNASCGICTGPGEVCIQVACDPATTPKSCAAVTCLAGETCTEMAGGAVCVSQQSNPCAVTLCPPNRVCEVVNGAAECKPVNATPGDASTGNGAGSCAVTLCPAGTVCDDISGTAQCIKAPSCDGTTCEKGQHCELKPVQCIRAPCPAQPTCVPDVKDVCATVKCKAGFHCEAKEVQCIRAPCPPIPECVADGVGVQCGKNTCGAGQECCNASCGTCVPKGGFCTQQICSTN